MKIVVPIMPRSLEEVQAIDVTKYVKADVIEWRADFLSKEKIMSVAPAVFEKFAGQEIIFTLRTTREGGQIDLTDEEYIDLIKSIDTVYHPDFIDFEYFSHKEIFEDVLDFSNLVLSYHNFEKLPENILDIFSELTSLAPKMVKISVMPESDRDVLDLINYSKGFKTLNPSQEYAVIGMGKLGKITRIATKLLGSSWTFASFEQSSAPGQINLAEMYKIRELLNED